MSNKWNEPVNLGVIRRIPDLLEILDIPEDIIAYVSVHGASKYAEVKHAGRLVVALEAEDSAVYGEIAMWFRRHPPTQRKEHDLGAYHFVQFKDIIEGVSCEVGVRFPIESELTRLLGFGRWVKVVDGASEPPVRGGGTESAG